MASLALVALTSVLALLPTARATAQPPTVQYSFCLITGTNTSGVQNSNTYSTVSYGIMNTSTPLSQYTTQGTYVDWDFINAFMYTSTNPLPQPLTQQPANTVRGYVFPGVDYFNDNVSRPCPALPAILPHPLLPSPAVLTCVLGPARLIRCV